MVEKAWNRFVEGFNWVYKMVCPKIVVILITILVCFNVIVGAFYAVYYMANWNIGKAVLSLFVTVMAFMFAWVWKDEVRGLWRFRP